MIFLFKPKFLFFHSFVQNEDKQESKIVRQIGNVTASTEITFEYGIRTGTKQDGGEDPVPMEIHQEGGTMYFKHIMKSTYSQTCVKRSHLGQRKCSLLRQVTSEKRFNSYKIFHDDNLKMTF